MKTRIKIEDIEPLKDSFQVPDDYFEGLMDRINQRKDQPLPPVSLDSLSKLEESFSVPDGYFDGLFDKIDERKNDSDNMVTFRSRRIRIWGSFVAAACITLVVLSVIKWGNQPEPEPLANLNSRLENISDAEIAGLLNERDDEFELTEEEIIEVITYESVKDESTAIIDYLEEEEGLEGDITEDEDFLEAI